MTEEERKTIDNIKSVVEEMYDEECIELDLIDTETKKIEHEEIKIIDIKKLYNLAEKQANEIKYVRKKNKELVEQRSTLQWEYEELQDAFNHYKSISIRKDNVVEKDKVMKVIDYFEQGMQKECNGYIEVKYPFEVSYSGKVAKILRKKLLEEE